MNRKSITILFIFLFSTAFLLTADADPCGDCILDVEGTAAYQLYNQYILAGKDPSCWCRQYQCRGDCNNDKNALGYRIYMTDLDRLLNCWRANMKIPSLNLDPCADVAHDKNALGYTCYSSDLDIIVTNWRKKDSALTDCPCYIVP